MPKRLFSVFSFLLDYPHAGFREAVEEGETLVSGNPDAARLLGQFRSLVETNSLGRLQELYSSTFDLGSRFSLYLGYHLFGETYKRSAFLLKLKELYRANGFRWEESEMPDHLAVILRFLATCQTDQLVEETVEEGLLPVLSKMIKEEQSQEGDGDSSPYHQHEGTVEQLDPLRAGKQAYQNVLKALQVVLETRFSQKEQIPEPM